ncbi:MAG TPA: ABC transporter permease [Acidobacteriota bacterium]|nr:ABC transporter permease [Acidobacteriota bacterium]
MAKSPSFSLSSVLVLALAIAAFTSVLSLFYTIFLKPLPYERNDHTVVFRAEDRLESIAPVHYRTLSSQITTFESLAIFAQQTREVQGLNRPLRVPAAFVSSSLFQVLRPRLTRGRVFDAREDTPGGPKLAIVSESLWRNRMAAAADLEEQNLTIGDEKYAVIGVMGEDFSFPSDDIDLWLPASVALPRTYDSPFARIMNLTGSLESGISLEAAEAEVRAVLEAVAAQAPRTRRGPPVTLSYLREHLSGDASYQYRVLMMAALFVLAVGVISMVNLLWIRGRKLQNDTAIRLALGGGGLRSSFTLLAESLLLSAAAASVGLILAYWCLRLLQSLGRDQVARLSEVGLHPPVVLAVGLVSLAGVVIATLSNRMRLSDKRMIRVLQGGAVRDGKQPALLFQNFLIVVEFALTLVLVSGTVLLVRNLVEVGNLELGFDGNQVLAQQIVLPRSTYSEKESSRVFFERAVDGLEGLAVVESAGAVTSLPLSGVGRFGKYVSREISNRNHDPVTADRFVVVSGYFEALGIPLLRGRLFGHEKDGPENQSAVVIDSKLADFLWPGTDPIGKELGRMMGGDLIWGRVIGVVGSVRKYAIDEEPMSLRRRGQVYEPLGGQMDNGTRALYLVARTSEEPAAFETAVRRVVGQIDQAAPFASTVVVDDLVRDSLAESNFYAFVMSLLALASVAIGFLGLYGVTASIAAARRPELGIRLALGAHPLQLLRRILFDGAASMLAGLIAGVLCAQAFREVLASLFFDVGQLAWSDLLTGVSALLIAGLLACFIPALRVAVQPPAKAFQILNRSTA